MTTTPTTLSLPSWGALFVEGEGGGVGQGVACAYFSMIRQLDNIKFALLLPEFVYGDGDEGEDDERGYNICPCLP